jgi:prolipoprotein diacylglyceryltransferase
MYPHDVILLGLRLSIWNTTLLVAVVLGYPVLRAGLRARRGEPLPVALPLRWTATVYVSALGAQLFAYLFDLNTGLTPPASLGWARYYLDPLAGPKTLYGAIVALPLGTFLATRVGRDLGHREALDGWTPATFFVLGISRVGCFLQGCCWGVQSDRLGLSFPPYGSLHWSQVGAGLIAPGSWTAPVVPAQLLEAAGLLGLAAAAMARLRAGRHGTFVPAVVAYSGLRFALEIVRADPDRNALGPFSTSQWIALAIVAGWLASRRALAAPRPA